MIGPCGRAQFASRLRDDRIRDGRHDRNRAVSVTRVITVRARNRRQTQHHQGQDRQQFEPIWQVTRFLRIRTVQAILAHRAGIKAQAS